MENGILPLSVMTPANHLFTVPAVIKTCLIGERVGRVIYSVLFFEWNCKLGGGLVNLKNRFIEKTLTLIYGEHGVTILKTFPILKEAMSGVKIIWKVSAIC